MALRLSGIGQNYIGDFMTLPHKWEEYYNWWYLCNDIITCYSSHPFALEWYTAIFLCGRKIVFLLNIFNYSLHILSWPSQAGRACLILDWFPAWFNGCIFKNSSRKSEPVLWLLYYLTFESHYPYKFWFCAYDFHIGIWRSYRYRLTLDQILSNKYSLPNCYIIVLWNEVSSLLLHACCKMRLNFDLLANLNYI